MVLVLFSANYTSDHLGGGGYDPMFRMSKGF